jgi:polyisoprenoid-binding protein YceI
MKTTLFSLSALALLAASGCKKAEKPKEAPAVPKAAPAPSPSAAPVASPVSPGRYVVDPVHSAVLFKVRHFGAGNVYAWFGDFEGSFVADADPTKSRVEVTVKTASIDTRVEKRNNHLRSPDFFNAAQFPTATFRSTRVERAADGNWSLSGDLTVRGKTKQVAATVVPLGMGKSPDGTVLAGLEAHLKVNRQDFDVKFMTGLLGDEIDITIALEGKKQ